MPDVTFEDAPEVEEIAMELRAPDQRGNKVSVTLFGEVTEIAS